jgi:CheY-like chemotaxis protein
METAAFRRDPTASTFIRASFGIGSAAKAPQAPCTPLLATTTRSTGGGLRVLLVDDNLMNQVYGEALIEKLGFRVAIASDGADAVQRWSAESFDLILMDCHMPVMDGFAAARRIRQSEVGRGTHTPIIALTGCTDDGEHHDCINAGMDAVLRKPFNPDELLALVDGWAKNNRVSPSLPRS